METATQASGCLRALSQRGSLTLQGHVHLRELLGCFWKGVGLCKDGPWICAFLRLETHC